MTDRKLITVPCDKDILNAIWRLVEAGWKGGRGTDDDYVAAHRFLTQCEDKLED